MRDYAVKPIQTSDPLILPLLCLIRSCIWFGLSASLGWSTLEATPYKKHFLSFITQNDGYVSPYIDRYYTAGHSLLYASKEGDYGIFNSLGFLEGETSLSFSLSQAIYTPKAKFDLIPPRSDHPYAGLLSLTLGIHHRAQNALESLGLRIGVSGKIAFAQEVQNRIHSYLNVGLANGWDTQIADELLVNFYYEWIYIYSLIKDPSLGLDVLSSFELAFGNANIYGALDAVLRVGYNLEHSFLASGVVGENGGLQSGRSYKDGISFFVFAGIRGAYVVRKMAIEGNLFKGTPASDAVLQPFTASLQIGISFLSESFSVGYKVIYQSKEFRTQDGSHAIGSVSLSYSF